MMGVKRRTLGLVVIANTALATGALSSSLAHPLAPRAAPSAGVASQETARPSTAQATAYKSTAPRPCGGLAKWPNCGGK